MKNCNQTDTQTIFEHCESVTNYTIQLIDHLKSDNLELKNWKIPSWLYLYKLEILNNLLSIDIITEYTMFHDIGKPHCLELDQFGKRHFPNHTEVSAKLYLEATKNIQVSKLISLDMKIHTIKENETHDFIKNKEAITLLLVALAEIHSNANMFGGIESLSFRIKFKQIFSKGKSVLKKLFGEK